MERIFYELRQWLEARNVSPDSLTVILNWTDPAAAAHFDAELKRHTEAMQMSRPTGFPDFRSFEVCGIKVRLESPLHDPHGAPVKYITKPQKK